MPKLQNWLRIRILFVSFLLIFISALYAPIIAKANFANPLIMTYSGDLWAWDGTQIERRTTWTQNFPPVISPDGLWIAYKSTAKIAVDAIATYGHPGGGGELPASIWLLNVATNDAIRIGDQPVNASIFNPNSPDTYIIRSDPAWSRDGTSIAWTEGIIAGGNSPIYRLVIYDIATKTSKTLVNNLPAPGNYEGFISMPVVWAEPGLAVLQSYVEMPNYGASVLIYNTDGQLVSTSPKILHLSKIVWIVEGAQVLVAMISPIDGSPNSVQWQLYSPLGGAPFPMQGSPELFSTTAPNGLSIYAANPNSTTSWTVANAPNVITAINTLKPYFGFLSDLAISPDGQSYAYADAQGIASASPSSFKAVVSSVATQGVVWGPVRWRVRH